ncbi:DDI2 [Cordylochernes scorpioides]|uniref:DDI2 n=1 Tax=Cordylochernes scorpioides TaxID=51811 RepID=A0ABY6KBY1_9ARAC|nr:DDI2 [Cordylochernes scorpioides]
MRLTITTLSDQLFSVDVSEDMELSSLQALCEFEAGIPAAEMVVSHEGRPLMDGRLSLRAYNIKEGDVLLIQHLQQSSHSVQSTPCKSPPTLQRTRKQIAGILKPSISFFSILLKACSQVISPASLTPYELYRLITGVMLCTATGSLPENMADSDPEYLRQLLLNNPDQLALLKHNNPPLAEALLSGNPAMFEQVFRQQQREMAERQRQRIRIINADPFDLEAQRLIAEEIRVVVSSQENVNSNMEAAMEYHPESFGQVVMLYVNCRVNGHPVKAFIDSGAQSTIMSQACAERCHIMRLVDQRWAGIAKGVGTQRIIGRVHLEISTKTKTSSIKEKFWNFKKANWNLYQQNTNEDFRKAPTSIKALEQNWISFKNTIIKAAKVSIPRVRFIRRLNIPDKNGCAIECFNQVLPVFAVQIQIGNDFLTSSFSILEEQPMDMLLGLDMLKRHQCNIDLRRNMLVIGTTGTETSFLTESELPECARPGVQGSASTSTRSTVQEMEDRELAEALARSASSADTGNYPYCVWSSSVYFFVFVGNCCLSILLFSHSLLCVLPTLQSASSSVTAAPTPAAPATANSILASDKFKEQDIQTLTKMGFARQQAIEELRRFNGDVTRASVALLAKSIKLP